MRERGRWWGLNGKMNKGLREVATKGRRRRRTGGTVKDNRGGEQRTSRWGWVGGARGNRWKVNGPGANPPDALGLDIWARGPARGVGFQRYIISFEEQHHSGRQPPAHPHRRLHRHPLQHGVCPVIDDTPPHPDTHMHKHTYSIVLLNTHSVL